MYRTLPLPDASGGRDVQAVERCFEARQFLRRRQSGPRGHRKRPPGLEGAPGGGVEPHELREARQQPIRSVGGLASRSVGRWANFQFQPKDVGLNSTDDPLPGALG